MWWPHPSHVVPHQHAGRAFRYLAHGTTLGGILAIGTLVQFFMLRSSIVFLIAALLGSCSISEHVVQDGPFQKRKYFKRGWFFDPPKRSGMEELSIDEFAADEMPVDHDPYLEMFAGDRLMPVELAEVDLQKLDLARFSTLDGSTAPVTRAARTQVPARSIHLEQELPPIPQQEYGTLNPMMSTGFAFLLPVALLFALVAFISRIGNLDRQGSRAETIAVLMGMAGLAALAMV